MVHLEVLYFLKIVIETEKGRKNGTGFILAFPIDIEGFYCLITNDHIINDESINNNRIIYISYEEYKTASIKLDRNKRYIKSFKNIGDPDAPFLVFAEWLIS